MSDIKVQFADGSSIGLALEQASNFASLFRSAARIAKEKGAQDDSVFSFSGLTVKGRGVTLKCTVQAAKQAADDIEAGIERKKRLEGHPKSAVATTERDKDGNITRVVTNYSW